MQIGKIEGRTWYVEDEIDEVMPPGADTPEGLFGLNPDDETGRGICRDRGNKRVLFAIGEEIALAYQDEPTTIMVAFAADGSFRITQGDASPCNTFGLADGALEWDPRGSLDEIARMLVEERFFDGGIPVDEPVEVEAFYASDESILFRFCEPQNGAPVLTCLTPERIRLYGAPAGGGEPPAQLPLGG